MISSWRTCQQEIPHLKQCLNESLLQAIPYGCQLITDYCDYNHFAQHNLQYAKSQPKSQRATDLWWHNFGKTPTKFQWKGASHSAKRNLTNSHLTGNYSKSVSLTWLCSPERLKKINEKFYQTRPKPAYGRQGLDWIFGPEYSFVVLSTNRGI